MTGPGEYMDRLSAALAESYTIERKVGAGGMATVYLAEDLKHHRKVAVKVLRPELAAVLGAERFVQEIKTTANLQHPHILPLFDSGEADTFLYYVMPFIDGESLRDRLNRETQLSVEDAVRISREVAEALDYAHRHDVIHRDIKPENILLHDGRAMVADFGIALAVSAAAGERMTETGLSLGTPHYMSPEQATAEKELTNRSDVYSLGCVLYEMLTGDPPHTGSSAQGIILKIVSDDVRSVTELRRMVPPHVAGAVSNSLQKLAADRFETAGKFAEALANPAYSPTPPGVMVFPAPVRALEKVSIAAAVIFAALAAWGWFRDVPTLPASHQRIVLWSAPPTARSVGDELAVAPDGSAFAFVDTVGNRRQLFVKTRGQPTGVPLAGTDDPFGPFFSPDGAWIGFWQDGQIKKVPTGGGAVAVVADSADQLEPAGAWLDDNSIVFGRQEHLMQVDENSGDVAELTPEPVRGLWYLHPLPSARGVVFSSCGAECQRPAIHAYDIRNANATPLFDGALWAGYVETGHLVYLGPDGVLFAVEFDFDTFETTGASVPVLAGVATLDVAAHVAVTPAGTLVYMRGPQIAQRGLTEPVWIDRAGRVEVIDSTWQFGPAQEGGLRLSPDGSKLAASVVEDDVVDVWVKVLPDGPFTRLTFGDGVNHRPTWAADGDVVSFVQVREDGCAVYTRPSDGSRDAERAVDRDDACLVEWSPDGEWMLYRVDHPEDRGNIHAIRPATDSTPRDLLTSPFHETAPALSHDGRWLAYASDESGRSEVYVRPFPDVESRRWIVSTDGGAMPFWSRTDEELFYINGVGELVAAEIDVSQPLSFTNRPLFSMARRFAGVSNFRAGIRLVDVTPDGEHFIALQGAGFGSIDSGVDLVLVENWLHEVSERLER